jgi:phospholipase/carboxylesterase
MITERRKYETGRLTTKTASTGQRKEFASGIQPIGLDSKKDGILYVPESYNGNEPAALAVMLHGSGASAEQGLSMLREYADAKNIILMAPAARSYTWDIIASDAFGPDVIYLDQALNMAFENFAIDAARVAIGGFSDGASYGLCIGLANGDLFTHLIAFYFQSKR